MTGSRRLTSFFLLAMLGAWGAAGAVLGIVQSPGGDPAVTGLNTVVANTLAASSYTEDLTETSSQSSQTDHVIYQSPDRLAGYLQNGKQRIYLAIIGTNYYRTAVVSVGASTAHLVFSRQATQSAQASDPARSVLMATSGATNVQRDGNVYTFTVTVQGQTEAYRVTVTDAFVSNVLITTSGAHLNLAISAINSSPPVQLPAGSTISGTAVPGTSSSSSSGSAS